MKKKNNTVPLLSHPLIGKRVVGTATVGSAKARRVTGVLAAYDSTVICIGKMWYWTTSITNMEEAL